MLTTPILLIIFKRPGETRRVFEAIRRARPRTLFVAADGPRSPEEEASCRLTREIIGTVDWECEVHRRFLDRNAGCKFAVSDAITWFFQNVEEGIILEDDTVPSPDFFPFCEELLSLYRHDTRISLIGGNNFQPRDRKPSYSYYFSRYGHIWGWATWRRGWALYDREMRRWPEIRATQLLRGVVDDENEYNYWVSIFDRVYMGEIDTWDYQWLFSAWCHSMNAILPCVNLVSNIGFGPGATHTTGDSPFANLPTDTLRSPLSHPPYLIRNEEADHHTATYLFNCRYPPGMGGQVKQDPIPPQHPKKHIFDLASRTLECLRDDKAHEALHHLDEIIALSQEVKQPLFAKALVLAKRGETGDAVGTVNQCLAKDPDHPGARALLAELASSARQDTRAVDALLDTALEHLAADRLENALPILSELKERRIRHPQLEYLRALCFIKLERITDAREALQEEILHFPGDREVEELLRDVLAEESRLKGMS